MRCRRRQTLQRVSALRVLEDAQAEAHRTGRNILAFVYDPTQEERGRLQHGLGYFLENRKTRDTINASFTVALVPLSQVAAVTAILEDESMERSRWIVLDRDLELLNRRSLMLTRKRENGSPSSWHGDTALDLTADLLTGTGDVRSCQSETDSVRVHPWL